MKGKTRIVGAPVTETQIKMFDEENSSLLYGLFCCTCCIDALHVEDAPNVSEFNTILHIASIELKFVCESGIWSWTPLCL